MTIKFKMGLIIGAVIAYSLVMIGLLFESLNKTQVIKQSEQNLTLIQADLLLMRQAEKDFMMHQDLAYVENFSNFTSQNLTHLNDLKQRMTGLGFDIDKFQTLENHITDYQNDFSLLVRAYQDVGLDEKSGLQGRLRQAVHTIEKQLNELDQVALSKDMLMLRRREKDFLLRMDLKYLDRLNRDVIVFEKNLTKSNLSDNEKASLSLHLKQYQSDFQAMVNGYQTLGLSAQSGLQETLSQSANHTEETLELLTRELNVILAEELKGTKQLALIITLLLMLMIVFLVIWVAREILTSVKHVSDFIRQINQDNDFSVKLDYHKNDEFNTVADSLNNFLSDLNQGMAETCTVVNAIAQGNFNLRIQAQLKGDLTKLKHGVNQSADSVAFSMQELEKVMHALHEGDFAITMDPRVGGNLSQMVNNSLSSIKTTFDEIILIMEKMEAGAFDNRVTVEAKGELLRLKNSLNQSMNALDHAMHDITEVVVAQSEGNLTQIITSNYPGELGILKDAVNTSAKKLTQVVNQATEASQIVNTAASEVYKGSVDLSQRVQDQASALEQTSATIDQMNAAVQNNSENARQTADIAQQVQNRANEGASVMNETISAMAAINESSHKISDIVSLIDGIAFQTNLLALNAAVEAARAGEHGRGFAVVAGEVRTLAQKSAEAAKDIKKLIDESVYRIETGARLAEDTGTLLHGVNQSINGMVDMINQIAQASAEQSEGIAQVHKAIALIDSATQQNAALVEQTSAASASLNEQAHILEKDMAYFKTPASEKQSTKVVQESNPKTQAILKNKSTQLLMEPKPLPIPAKPKKATQEWEEF